MKPVLYTDEEYQEILQYLNQLTSELEQLPYPTAKELSTTTLQYFDLVHREALARLMGVIQQKHPELLKTIQQDMALRTMFGLYDLLEIETSKQEKKPQKRMGFVPIESVGLLSPIMETHWVDAGNEKDIEAGKLYPKEIAQENVLVCRIGEKIYALKNACLDSVLPMQFGTIEGTLLICPWHGCRYDIPTGTSKDHPDAILETYRIAIDRTGDFKIGIKREKSSNGV